MTTHNFNSRRLKGSAFGEAPLHALLELLNASTKLRRTRDKCEAVAALPPQPRSSMMTSQLTTTRPAALVVPTETSPWREAANEEMGGFGPFLKFIKNEWLIGEEQTQVAPTAMFIANMLEYWRGWTKWQDNRPVAHVIGRVVDRFRVPARDELGDLDEALRENDASGNKRDPWQPTRYLVMRNAENDEIVTFTTGSDGGIKATGKLCDRYDWLRHKHPAKMPVVTLSSESYVHRDFGKVWKPKFVIVGWDYWDDEARNDPAGALQRQRADEIGDSIPY
jgi:hypothetical protein